MNLTTSGLLDAKRLSSWVPEKRKALRRAVVTAMKIAGKEIVGSVRNQMQQSFKVHKAGFVKSMRHKIYAGSPEKFPALLIGSKIPWLGIHVRGATIAKKMLIPLLPTHQRLGRKAFARVVDALMRSGNAFFIKKGGKTILMAENIKDNAPQLRKFKRAQRNRTGAKTVKKGQEIPIAVLVSSVTLRARFDLAASVRSQLSVVSTAIVAQLDAQRL